MAALTGCTRCRGHQSLNSSSSTPSRGLHFGELAKRPCCNQAECRARQASGMPRMLALAQCLIQQPPTCGSALQAKGPAVAVLAAAAHNTYSPGPGSGEGPVATPPLEEHPILVGKLTLLLRLANDQGNWQHSPCQNMVISRAQMPTPADTPLSSRHSPHRCGILWLWVDTCCAFAPWNTFDRVLAHPKTMSNDVEQMGALGMPPLPLPQPSTASQQPNASVPPQRTRMVLWQVRFSLQQKKWRQARSKAALKLGKNLYRGA